jgi:hypothetical protein
VQELRPDAVGQFIAHDGQDGLPAVGDLLDDASRLASASRRVHDEEAPRARDSVVPARDPDHAARMVWNRPRVEEGVGEVGVAAEVLHLACSIGIHLEEDPRVRVGEVGVLPSQVEDTAVWKDRRAPVVLLVHGELADAPIVLEAVEVRHVGGPVDAGHAHEGGGGREDHPAIRQVASIVVVDVRFADELEFPGVRAVERHLEDLPAPVGTRHGEEDPIRVGVEVHVAHELPARGLEDRDEAYRGSARGEGREAVVPALRVQA